MEKIRLDVSSDYSARQRIHMKNQALFSLTDKSKKVKCRLLQFLFGALRGLWWQQWVTSTDIKISAIPHFVQTCSIEFVPCPMIKIILSSMFVFPF